MADQHQPLRRGDDAFRRRVRRDVSSVAPGPAVFFLLAGAVSQRDAAVAAVPQPAGLGCFRGVDVCHGLAGLLVRGADPRPCFYARPSRRQAWPLSLRVFRARLERLRASLGPLSEGVSPSRRPGLPLVEISVHSGRRAWTSPPCIVPGWHSTIQSPYFVGGAIFSGFAMVLTLAIPLRHFYGLQDFITTTATSTTACQSSCSSPAADRRLRLLHGSCFHGLVFRQRQSTKPAR